MDRLDELRPDWRDGDPSITESGKRQKSMGSFSFWFTALLGGGVHILGEGDCERRRERVP